MAVGQEAVVGDRREGRWHRRALRHHVRGGLRGACVGGAHDSTHGPCQPPKRSTRRSASAGPHVPGAYGCTSGGWFSSGSKIRHVSSTPSWRVKRLLSPRHRVEQQHLVGRRRLAALLGELDVEVDLLRAFQIGAVRVEDQARARRRIELDDELVRFRPAAAVLDEAELRGMAEHGAQLGLRDREALAGADEPRHPAPAPVVDLQAQRGVGLRRRVLRDAVDVAVAVVLAADVVRGVGRVDRAEERELGVLEAFRVGGRGRLHRRDGDDLHEVVDDHVAHRADRVVEVPAVLDAEALGHRDLHAGDVVAVPDRLDHRVGEAQVEELVGPHLPEEVVDPVELRLRRCTGGFRPRARAPRRGRARTASRPRPGRSS